MTRRGVRVGFPSFTAREAGLTERDARRVFSSDRPTGRRAFLLASLGSVASRRTWAQQPGKTHRIGWLDLSSSAENLGVFVQAMGARGWPEGQAFRLDYRGGEGKADRLLAVTEELVRVPVQLIVAPGTPETLAARKATGSIPIVMAGVDDPVGRGLVASLARPGGNVTGLANAGQVLGAKLLSLSREIVPGLASATVLWDASDREQERVLRELRSAGQALGLAIEGVDVRRHTDVEPAIAAMGKRGVKLLVVSPSPLLIPRWIADLAAKQRLPLVSIAPGYAYEGGLLAYTDDLNEVYERMATFCDRILRGAKPGNLPVELPTRFRLIVNARTAQRLGLAIPPSIRLWADRVIE